jgi:hypothetical protein
MGGAFEVETRAWVVRLVCRGGLQRDVSLWPVVGQSPTFRGLKKQGYALRLISPVGRSTRIKSPHLSRLESRASFPLGGSQGISAHPFRGLLRRFAPRNDTETRDPPLHSGGSLRRSNNAEIRAWVGCLKLKLGHGWRVLLVVGITKRCGPLAGRRAEPYISWT